MPPLVRLGVAGLFILGLAAISPSLPVLNRAWAGAPRLDIAGGIEKGLRLIVDVAHAGEYQPDQMANLVRFNGRDYRVNFDDSVSGEPLSSARIKKIGYGRVTDVSIVTTTSGTYSTDALMSPHVRYPGVSVEKLPLLNGTLRGLAAPSGPVGYWRTDFGWVRMPLDAGSFVTMVRGPNGHRAILTDDVSCFSAAGTTVCR